jgi:hypothetical protein
MSDYDEQMRLWHEGKITARPIRIDSIHDKDMQISQLIRERDEARAEAKEAKELMQVHAAEIFGAEARGFERGVREAAEATEEYEIDWRVGPSENRLYIKRAILALLEPTLQKPEA